MAKLKKDNGFRHFKPLIDLILFDRVLSQVDLQKVTLPFSEEFILEKEKESRSDINNPFLRKQIIRFIKDHTTELKRNEIFMKFEKQHNSRKMYYTFFEEKIFDKNKYFNEYLEFCANGFLSNELIFLFHEHFIDLLSLEGTEVAKNEYEEILSVYLNTKEFNLI